MNIDVTGYTREQILSALFSSDREVRFEYSITNSLGANLGYIEIQEGRISFDSSSDVMRTFSGKVKKSDILNLETIDYRVTPYMCLMMPNGKEAKWALGKFIIYPAMSSENDINMIEVSGFDLGKIALDDKNVSRYFVDSSDLYTTAISSLLNSIYTRTEITAAEDLKSFPQEWEIGTSKMKIINDLLQGINYNPLYFDENGVAICEPHISLTEREIDFTYFADNQSIIVDGIKYASNKFDIPNKWVRYTENAEVSYLISEYTNDSYENPYSTVNRGRTIVDAAVVEDIASQDALDAYVARIAADAMMTTEQLEFTTLNMPGHGYQECLYVDVPVYGIQGKYIEKAWEMELETGGKMSHVCEKVVVV